MQVEFLLKCRSKERDYHQQVLQELQCKIEEYRAQGLRVAGYTVVNNWDEQDRRCSFLWQDLVSGEQFPCLDLQPPQDTPAAQPAVCDYYLVGDGVQRMVARMASADAEVLVFGKVGKWEMAGGGFLPLLQQLVAQGGSRRLLLSTRTSSLNRLVELLGLRADQYCHQTVELAN